jgi:hypothetical protein
VVGRGKTVGQVGVGSREFAVLYGGPVGLQFDAVNGLGLCGNAQGKGSKKEGTIHRVYKITKVKMQIRVSRLHKSQLLVTVSGFAKVSIFTTIVDAENQCSNHHKCAAEH